MLYNIDINQYAIMQSGIDIDLIDAAILDFIHKFSHCSKAKAMVTDKGKYFLLQPKLIIQELPILGINTERGIQKRIAKLVDCGLLEKEMFLGKSFYQLTSLSYDLFFVQKDESRMECKSDEQVFADGRTTVRKEANGGSHYNNIIDNNKTDNNIYKGDAQKDEFDEVLNDWFDYKKSLGKPYKNEKSKGVCKKKLREMSYGNVEVAKKIVEQSIANNWQGLFPIRIYNACESKDEKRMRLATMADNMVNVILEHNGTKPF